MKQGELSAIITKLLDLSSKGTMALNRSTNGIDLTDEQVEQLKQEYSDIKQEVLQLAATLQPGFDLEKD
jgi:hypothetical protein